MTCLQKVFFSYFSFFSRQLIVYVADGNENDLEFEADEYHVTVLENSKLNSSVAAVQAWNTDQDDHGRVTYESVYFTKIYNQDFCSYDEAIAK